MCSIFALHNIESITLCQVVLTDIILIQGELIDESDYIISTALTQAFDESARTSQIGLSYSSESDTIRLNQQTLY